MPMRQPTPDAVKYAHWAARLAGEPVEVHESEFHPGFYEMATGKRGPDRKLIPVQVHIVADVDWLTGELTEDEKIVAWSPDGVVDLSQKWTYLRPISRERYDMLCNMTPEVALISIADRPMTPPKQEGGHDGR